MERFAQTMNEDFEEFIDNYKQDPRSISEFENLQNLFGYTFILGPVLMTLIVAATVVLRIYNLINFDDIGLYYSIGLTFLLVLVFISPIFLITRRIYQLDVSPSDYTYHKLAILLEAASDPGSNDEIGTLFDITSQTILDIHRRHLAGLTPRSRSILNAYSNALSEAHSPKSSFSETYEEVLSPIVAEIELINEKEILDIIDTIEGSQSDRLGYRATIKRMFSTGRTSGRILRVVFAVGGIGTIGLLVFFSINKQLGMLITLVLLGGYETLRS